MKRVFIISPTESHLTKRGKRHPDLASYLQKFGYNVIYISSNFNHAQKILISEKEITENTTSYKTVFIENGLYLKNISIKRIYWNLKFGFKTYLYLKKENLNDKDLIIIPSRPPELIYFMSILKKKFNCKMILDIRDVWPDGLVTKGFLRFAFQIYCNFYQRNSVNKFDRFIHVAPSFLKWLKRYSPSTNSCFIPLGIDKRFYEFKPKKIKTDLSIIFGGALSYQCNISNIVHAIENLKINFTIFGDSGNGDLYNEIQELSAKNSRITLLNYIPQNEVPDLYSKSDVSVIYMISGALPNKFFDAIGSLTPILAIGDGDVANIVNNYDLGWCVENDILKIRDLLKNITREDINSKIINIKKIKEKYFRKNLLKKFRKIIEEL